MNADAKKFQRILSEQDKTAMMEAFNAIGAKADDAKTLAQQAVQRANAVQSGLTTAQNTADTAKSMAENLASWCANKSNKPAVVADFAGATITIAGIQVLDVNGTKNKINELVAAVNALQTILAAREITKAT